MTTDPIISFAQDRFSSDDLPSRARAPEWLVTNDDLGIIPIESGELVGVDLTEGDSVDGPAPSADGTTPDALAFYLPFHYYQHNWGIYVRAAGVWEIARKLGLLDSVPDNATLEGAYNLLYMHERFHFLAEYAASRLEVVTAQPCYDRYFRLTEAEHHEEAMANADGLRELQKSNPNLVREVKVWMSTQGQGYCDYDRWLGPRFLDGERVATGYMSKTAENANRLHCGNGIMFDHEWHPAEFLFTNARRRHIPTRVVMDASVPWLRVAKPFPKDYGLQVYVYSNDHRPPHIHIDCPPGKPYARYLWPELTPFDDREPKLSSKDRDRLDEYLRRYGNAIGNKIATIPWN